MGQLDQNSVGILPCVHVDEHGNKQLIDGIFAYHYTDKTAATQTAKHTSLQGKKKFSSSDHFNLIPVKTVKLRYLPQSGRRHSMTLWLRAWTQQPNAWPWPSATS